MSLTPFLMVGGGWLGGISESMGNDADPAFQFGVGLKAPLGHLLSARLDLRDTMTQKFNAADGDQTHHPEILLGLTVNMERSRPKPPPPAADSDKDGVPDTQDKCPKDGALTADGCPLDSDSDGVLDRDDHCPREKGDQPDGCLAPDADGDGVHRLCDKCPSEKGIEPDGCPLGDTDGDGIFDDVDRCPKDPETKNGFDDKDGCPDEVPQEVQQYTGSIEGIFFERNKAKIRDKSFKMLDAAVAVLQKFEGIRLEISGHTSSEGDAERNKELSLERADAVKTYLLEKGVAPDRIVARGAGPDEPVADNKTAKGREQNRRIEFKILSQ
jgi:OOP family OmpA-OmpF porin